MQYQNKDVVGGIRLFYLELYHWFSIVVQ